MRSLSRVSGANKTIEFAAVVRYALRHKPGSASEPMKESEIRMPIIPRNADGSSSRHAVTRVAPAWLSVTSAFSLFIASPSACADSPIPVPPGFALQKLDITDGSVARPIDWTYANHGTSTGWLYTIARKPTKEGYYQTGLRIQLIANVNARTGMSPTALVKQFIDKKTATTATMSQCGPTAHPQVFVRRCLESREQASWTDGPYVAHIAFTFFSSDERDVAVVTTFEAPDEEWSSTRAIADVMSVIELFGPKCCGPSADGDAPPAPR
jgi:hypothetical protein